MAEAVTEQAEYEAFVRSTLQHVQRGLEMDHTAKKRTIAAAMTDVVDPKTPMDVEKRVLCGRFALGGDDAAYLQSGVATLWSTAAGSKTAPRANELELAPKGLYAPDAIDGIRSGLIRAIRDRTKDLKDDAPAQLNLLSAALKTLFSLASVQTAVLNMTATIPDLDDKDKVDALFKTDWTTGADKAKKELYLRLLSIMRDVLKTKANGPNLATDIIAEIKRQLDTISDQKKKIGTLKSVRDKLNAKLKLMRSVIAAKDQEIVDLEKELFSEKKRLGNEKTKLEEDLRIVTDEKTKLEQIGQLQAAEIAALTTTLESTKRLLEEAKEEVGRLKTKLEKTETELANETATRVKAEQALELKEEEIGRLKINLALNVTKIEELEKDARKSKKEIQRNYKRIVELKEERRTLTVKFEDASGKARRCGEDLVKKTEQLDRLKSSFQKASEENQINLETARRTEARLREQEAALREELEIKRGEIGRLLTRQAAALRESERVQEELSNLSGRYAELEEQFRELQQRSQSDASTHADERAALQEELQTLEAESERIRAASALRTANVQREFVQDDVGETYAQWNSVVDELLRPGPGEPQTPNQKALDILNRLSVACVRNLFLNAGTEGRQYKIQNVFLSTDNVSTPEAIAFDASAPEEQLAGQCRTFGNAVLTAVSQTMAGAASDLSRAVPVLCENVLRYGLFKPERADVGRDAELYLPVDVDRGILFMPMTSAMSTFVTASPANEEAMSELLKYMYQTPDVALGEQLATEGAGTGTAAAAVATAATPMSTIVSGSNSSGIPSTSVGFESGFLNSPMPAWLRSAETKLKSDTRLRDLRAASKWRVDRALPPDGGVAIPMMVFSYTLSPPFAAAMNVQSELLQTAQRTGMSYNTSEAAGYCVAAAGIAGAATFALAQRGAATINDDTMRYVYMKVSTTFAEGYNSFIDAVRQSALSEVLQNPVDLRAFKNVVVRKGRATYQTLETVVEETRLSSVYMMNYYRAPVVMSAVAMQRAMTSVAGNVRATLAQTVNVRYTERELLDWFAGDVTDYARVNRLQYPARTTLDTLSRDTARLQAQSVTPSPYGVTHFLTYTGILSSKQHRDASEEVVRIQTVFTPQEEEARPSWWNRWIGIGYPSSPAEPDELPLIVTNDALGYRGPTQTTLGDRGGDMWIDDPGALFLSNADDGIDGGDVFSRIVVARGLCGQRGPLQPAHVDACPQDKHLPYELPDIEALANIMPRLRSLLAVLPNDDDDHQKDDVTASRTGDRVPSDDLHAHAALHALKGNFAIIGANPVDGADGRHGIECAHEVRWLPQGHRGEREAECAVYEHAIARCLQAASAPSTPSSVKEKLTSAAACLKMQQMESLYALRESVEYAIDDDDRVSVEKTAPIVTRPCAVVRGVLSFPTDAGVCVAPDGLTPAGSDNAFSTAATLEQAVTRCAPQTKTLRNQIRTETGQPALVYIAPQPDEMPFQPSPHPTGAIADQSVQEAIAAGDFNYATWIRILNRALTNVRALQEDTMNQVDGILDSVADNQVQGVLSTARDRRSGIWTEFQRHVGISQDRLWVFVRTMSGCIGGDVTEIITMADEQTQRATKALQEQRVQIAKRVSDTQSKIVESVVASMLRESTLTLDKDKDGTNLVVIDAAAKKQLSDLATGDSGRPFFESNVAVRNLTSRTADKTDLRKLLSGLAQVGAHMQQTLEASLSQPAMANSTLAELSHPSNSYFVSLKADAMTAIRVAHERLNVEIGSRNLTRRVALWELVEGGCSVLTMRFAQFAGHVLVQARSSTGVSALYIPQQAIQVNAIQARSALERLVNAASVYVSRVPEPSFDGSFDSRGDTMTAGSQVTDVEVGRALTPIVQKPYPLYAPISMTGWGYEGGKRY